MAESSLQLEMSFDSNTNRFKKNLKMGNFCVLIEHSIPSFDTNLMTAKKRLQELEDAVLCLKDPFIGLALTTRFGRAKSLNEVEYFNLLSKENRDRHLLYISGKGRSARSLSNLSQACLEAGCSNIVATTGSYKDGGATGGNKLFTDSVKQLVDIKANANKKLFAGCVVNPFKYTATGTFGQYLKLSKKINSGAAFVVAQSGWDIAKFQELCWYLGYRNLYYPSIANLQFFRPEDLLNLDKGKIAGMQVSLGIVETLKRESKLSKQQFEAAQWRRLELQVAGCRLLGYSGVQITGLDSPKLLQTAQVRLTRALQEFKDFADWRVEYLGHISRMHMASYPNDFYLFKNLLKARFFEEGGEFTSCKSLQPSKQQKRLYKLRKFILSHTDRQRASAHLITKKLFAGCKGCTTCQLPKTFFICHKRCPKGLANGPCGDSSFDNTCEMGNQKCIYEEILQLATWLKKTNALETDYIN